MATYDFSERFQKVLTLSREEAARYNHEYLGTEHLLLGLIKDGGSTAATALANLNVRSAVVHQTISNTVKMGSRPLDPTYVRPFTSRAKKVLDLSVDEAGILGHSSVGPEHLLLGLIREKTGIAAQVLFQEGLTESAAREEVLRLTERP